MAFTQTDIDALKAAIATGALQVRYADGRQITYRSFVEMKQTLAMLQAEVSPISTPPSRAVIAGF